MSLTVHQEVEQHEYQNLIPQSEETLVAAEQSPRRKRLVQKCLAVLAVGSAVVVAGNQERTSVYGHLAKVNIEHAVRDVNPFAEADTDPESFEYLEYQYGVDNGLFTDDEFGNYTHVWPHSQAVSAYRIASLTPGSEQFYPKYKESLSAADYYWTNGGGNTLPGYDASIKASIFGETERFVDDNLWMGLILAKDYEEGGEAKWLHKAEQVFAIALEQWDEDRGGIYWQVQWPKVTNNTRALVSNAPAVQLGVKLYELTGDAVYLQKSEEIFDWLKDHKDDNEGLFYDHVRIDNTYEYTKWSYVQGSVAGAMASLALVHPEKYSLDEAVEFANTSMDSLEQGKLLGEPAFDAIYFKNLLWIASLQNDEHFTQRVQELLAKTVEELPDKPSDVLSAAGAMQLRALRGLPVEKYKTLL